MKKIHYNKLIRDNIPEKMTRLGAAFETRILTQQEFKLELLKKVGEEASALPPGLKILDIGQTKRKVI
jgi:predicted house-cleaning noncanonical NTP pyrophosphatase (MazG superfamily)